jgi:hypothetical protein
VHRSRGPAGARAARLCLIPSTKLFHRASTSDQGSGPRGTDASQHALHRPQSAHGGDAACWGAPQGWGAGEGAARAAQAAWTQQLKGAESVMVGGQSNPRFAAFNFGAPPHRRAAQKASGG